MQILALSLLLAPVPLLPPQDAEEARDPSAPWFDRHFAFVLRDMPFSGDLEVYLNLPSQPEPQVMTGRVVFGDVRNYEIELVTALPDPASGQPVEQRTHILADGTHVWLESRVPGRTPSVERRTLELLADYKMLQRQTGGSTVGLDPLDILFDYGPVQSSFNFRALGRQERNGNGVYVFEGQVKPPGQLSGEVRRFYQAGARTAEVVFDARTGLLLSYELRGPEGVFSRTRLTGVEFPEKLDRGRFRYEPPAGAAVADRDPEYEKALGRDE